MNISAAYQTTRFLPALLVLIRLAVQAQTPDAFNPGANNLVNALAIQTDGKILVGGGFTNLAGGSRGYLGRLNSDGSLDPNFTAAANGVVNCLLVQQNGQIVVGGSFTSLGGLACYNIGRLSSSGSVDSTFGMWSRVANPATVLALAQQADGRILLAGSFNSIGSVPRTNIARLTTSGAPDLGFNAGAGINGQTINCLAMQVDGKILIGGTFTNLAGQWHTNLARLNTDGSLDSNFNAVADGAVHCLAVQPDGKIVAGGAFTNLAGQTCSCLGRLNADGGFDPAFVGGASGAIYCLALQADGKILAAGSFTNLATLPCNYVGRLNTNGSLDSGFSVAASSNVLALAIQGDGKILLGGEFTTVSAVARARIARMNNTGIASQSVMFDGTTVTWLRGGNSPEVGRTSFEFSTNGGSLFLYGAGSRISGGWRVAGLSFSTNATLRARGYPVGGKQSGSGWVVETNYGPPLITSQPAARLANATRGAVFTVSAFSGSPLSYQWRKNGVNLINGGNVSGALTSALSLNNLFGADAGDYSCAVGNMFGSVTSRTAALTVIDPIITTSPTDVAINPGEIATFSVGALGTAPLGYQWRKDGTNIAGATASSIVWSNAQPSDAGSHFDAVVTSAFGTTNCAPAVLGINLVVPDDFCAGPVPYGADVFSQCLQSDGKIVIGGAFQKIGDSWFASIARLNSDGTPEPDFHPTGNCCFGVHGLAIQPGGMILAVGQVPNNIGRLTTAGIWDATFNPAAAGLCVLVNCLALQSDGRILAGGTFTSLGGQPSTNLGRLYPNGTLDTGFHNSTATSCSHVDCLALQPDGKILFGGILGAVNTSIGRLNPDGTADSTFQTWGPSALYGPNCILVQPDGRILVAAQFSKSGGQVDFLGRLMPDGSLDTSFNPRISWSGTVGHAVQSMALQADGKILLGGGFTAIAESPRQYLARLNNDGTLDPTFAPVADGAVYSLALQADGRIIAGGHFHYLGGAARDYIGRLNNTTPATQKLSYDGIALTWERGGASPEVWRTTFDISSDGTHWTSLGPGVRIPGGWRLAAAALPTNAVIRARGFAIGGQCNASTWFVETSLTLDPRAPPQIVTDDNNFGARPDGFGFGVAGLQGQTVLIEASTNLIQWMALATNSIVSDVFYFKDSHDTNTSIRFYRARLP